MRPVQITLKINKILCLTLLSLAAFHCPAMANDTPQAIAPTMPNTIDHSPQMPNNISANLNHKGVLTLKQAVALSLNRNTSVKTALATRRMARFDLISAKDDFKPKIAITANGSYSKSEEVGDTGDSGSSFTRSTNIGPSLSWTLPTGTAISGSAGYNPSYSSNSQSETATANWDINITQQLLQGSSYDVNMIPLYNAEDAQITDDLTLDKAISTQIVSTTKDYYAYVQSSLSLQVAKRAWDTAKANLKSRKQMYKFGRVSKSDFNQSQLDQATQEQSYNQALLTENTNRTTLLNDMNLPQSVTFKPDLSLKLTPPQTNYTKTLKIAREQNYDLHSAIISNRAAERGLKTAQDKQRWQLYFQLERSYGLTNTIPDGETPNSYSRQITTSGSLNLTIPLDRMAYDKAQLQASIDKKNAELTLQTAQTTLANNLKSNLQNLHTSWVQIQQSDNSLKLANEAYKAAQTKFQFGMIDAFTLSQQQKSIAEAENAVINAKIAYINTQTSYRDYMGSLLKYWHVQFKEERSDA